MDKYHIAFLALSDVKNKRSWSGTLYNISKSLQKHFDGNIYYIEPFNAFENKILLKTLCLFNFLLEKGLNRGYLPQYNKLLCKNLSKYIKKNLNVNILI